MRYRIGARLIDSAAYEVRCEDRLVHVEPQVFDLLVMLIQRRDRVVSKEEIIAHVWQGRVVSDATLNSRIKTARQVLGDDGLAQKFIRTVHGRGFRFVADVEEVPTCARVGVTTANSGGPAADSIPQERLRPPPDRPSLVVMPFDNLSGEGDDYFVDGMVEEITSALSRVRDFFVIARQSAFTYKGRFADVRQVGRELGVVYVVEGTVRRGGDRLRISVQLVDAESRAQLWSNRYEGAGSELFDLQDQIAAQVAGAIHPAVRNAEIELARRKAPTNLKAYDLVLRAYPNLWSQNQASNNQGIALLAEAVALEPEYGRAHALLAWCLSQEVVYFWCQDAEAGRAKALKAVEAAWGRIDDDPTALTAAGAALSQCGDQERAAACIESAISLDPNNAWAWSRNGWVTLYRNQPEDAKERFERALRLSPLDPFAFNTRIGIASVLAMRGLYESAAAVVGDVVAKHPQVTAHHRLLAAVSALAGDLVTARAMASKILAVHPDASIAAVKAGHPMRHLPHYFGKLVEGLRLAGLPEG
jgi:TolB-like protein